MMEKVVEEVELLQRRKDPVVLEEAVALEELELLERKALELVDQGCDSELADQAEDLKFVAPEVARMTS